MTFVHAMRRVRVKSTRAALRLVAVGFLLLVTGCETVEKYSLTYRLWDNGDMRKWSEPAPDPSLALFDATNGTDVLVQYAAVSERHSSVQRRAYYLQQNEALIGAGKKPELVGLEVADGMKPIAVLPTLSAVSNLSPEPPAYAVVTEGGRGFTLFRPPEPETTYDFPVYPETSGTPTRLVLTPFAVAGDTVMVGMVAAVVGFCWWLQSGAPH
jgi:hypothetical protein